MNIELNKISPTNASIKITINEADYQPEVEKKIKGYSKTAVLKGFRPGKVPPALLKKMYGKGIMIEEVESLLSKSLFDYIRENEIKVVGEPLPDNEDAPEIDWENQKDFEFAFRLGISSEFDYDLSQLMLTDYQVKVEAEEINERLDNLRKRLGKHENPETVLAGDFVYGMLRQIKEQEAALEGEEVQEVVFEQKIFLPLNQLKEEKQEKFIDLKKGERTSFEMQDFFKEGAKGISLATGLSEEEAGQLQGNFEFEVESITRLIPAEMNEEFFNSVFKDESIDTEEAFMARFKEDLAGSYSNDSGYLIEKQIKDSLLKNTRIDLPDDFLKEWLELVNRNKFTKEDIEKEYEGFAKNLRWTLLRNKIAKDEGLQVETEEVIRETRELIKRQTGLQIPETPEITQRIDEIIQNYLFGTKDTRNYEKVYTEVLHKKVMECIRRKVSATQVEIDKEQFDKLFAVEEDN